MFSQTQGWVDRGSHYKFIPMVHRTHCDGSLGHGIGIGNIRAGDYEAMPSQIIDLAYTGR